MFASTRKLKKAIKSKELTRMSLEKKRPKVSPKYLAKIPMISQPNWLESSLHRIKTGRGPIFSL